LRISLDVLIEVEKHTGRDLAACTGESGLGADPDLGRVGGRPIVILTGTAIDSSMW
jgi:hypothetical protein